MADKGGINLRAFTEVGSNELNLQHLLSYNHFLLSVKRQGALKELI